MKQNRHVLVDEEAAKILKLRKAELELEDKSEVIKLLDRIYSHHADCVLSDN
jgi:hypothetical protein